MQMSRMLLPKMVTKGGGVIVNISSCSSLRSMPDICIYSATKVLTICYWGGGGGGLWTTIYRGPLLSLFCNSVYW